MRTSVRWSEAAEAVNGVRPPINSVAYSPSGDYVVASCGVRVLVYAASTGTLLHSLKGHQDTVYSVDYCSDGKRFVSGGADRVVIVWANTGEGVVKYQHKESVQAVVANPTTSQVASVSSIDWGIWSPELPKVSKAPLASKGLCGAWTPDGQTLAIGTIDGSVLIIAQGMEEKQRIRRNAPVWALAFNPQRENGVDILTIGSWDQRLSFYTLNGTAAGKEKELDCDPCSISYCNNGEYILISGSDHKVTLYTRDGNRLVNVADSDDWVWSAKQRPRHRQICCGTNDGTISCVEVNMTTVHCIYQDQYVCRDKMTDVMVHQLTVDRKMRIPCNDYVRKLATYRDRLAVQLQERIVIFELFYDDERNMRYQDIAQIRKRLECSMLCVTANALVLCKDRRLTLYDFQGNKRREWVMGSTIRYMKVAGGVEGRELLLVGLKSGEAVKVFVDNPFPTQLLTVNSAIQCLDLSSSRTKLAVVDENNLLQVFDLEKKNEVVFSETNANAVAWNTDFEGMIAYSTGGSTLNIKTDGLEPYQQPMRGVVVGFKANRVFNLHYANMIVVDVPHAHALYRYIEEKDFEAAYRIASLGVTESDWKMLGMHAMTNLELDIARRAFTHIQEVRFVELLNELELARRQRKTEGTPTEESTQQGDGDGLLLADILAFQGKYHDAARQFLKSGKESRAIDMYCDLKMWDEARKVCSDQNHLKELIRQQARWAEDSQNYVEAASLYETCGDYAKVVSMLGQSGQTEKLRKLCGSLPKTEVALITQCAVYFRQNQSTDYALEAYEKVGDNRALIQIYVEMGDWRRAFAILDKHPQFARDVYVPWANWLADNDKFEEAVEAFRAAKWPQEAVRMMETLASNSVTCRKFRDAAFYLIHLANEYGQFEEDEKLTESQLAYRIKLSNDCMRKADMYYAYSAIYTNATQPLPYNELKLFRMSRYLLAMCSHGVIPVNIGKAEVLYTLARTANRLEMIRTARAVFEKLQTVILPLPIMEQVDIETLMVRGKSFTDREELLDTCYRCKQVVPQLTDPGDQCPNCSHPFVRSFARFEVLPLVEFTLANDVTDEEAERLIRTGLGRKGGIGHHAQDERDGGGADAGSGGKKGGDKEWQADTGANVMSFEQGNIDYEIDRQLLAMGKTKAATNRTGDPFVSQLQYITRAGRPKGVYTPFVVTIDMIRSFHRDEIFIVKPPYGSLPVPNRYYRLMKPDVRITQCEGCQHFFTSEEYEFECMKGSGCPVCRFHPGREVGHSLREVMVKMGNARDGQPSSPLSY